MGSKVKSFEHITQCERAIPVDVETFRSRLHMAHARYICGSIRLQWQEDNATQDMKMTVIMTIFWTIPMIMRKVFFLQFTICTSRATYYIVSLLITFFFLQTNVHVRPLLCKCGHSYPDIWCWCFSGLWGHNVQLRFSHSNIQLLTGT